MFKIFLFVEYLRETSNYPKRNTLFDPTHMMSMVDHITIGVDNMLIRHENTLLFIHIKA